MGVAEELPRGGLDPQQSSRRTGFGRDLLGYVLAEGWVLPPRSARLPLTISSWGPAGPDPRRRGAAAGSSLHHGWPPVS